MFYNWLILLFAILTEVGGTVALKFSEGFSRIIPTLLVFVLYGLSFWGLAVALKKIEVGVAYAVWSGVGTAVVALLGIWFLGEKATVLKMASLALIITGVIGLNITSPGH